MALARILIWSLSDSTTTLAELREHLPELPAGDAWVSNDAQERFGLISFSSELPDLSELVRLTGREPDVAEEFDVE